MKETNIPKPDEMEEKVKKIVKFHYGFKPKDEDIESIDKGLRNNYSVLHNQQIIRELVIQHVYKEILKNREKIGSNKFETIWLEKSIFRYLTYASMCYKAGIPMATIILCRTAIETGLRERIAEELAKRECKNNRELPEKIWSKMETELKSKTLGSLIKKAEELKIIKKDEIEKIFKEFKFGKENNRRILDKFVHGDIPWIEKFVRSKERDTTVIGAKNKLEENKIVSDLITEKIAIEILKSTLKIAEILYYKCHTITIS